MVLSVGFVCRTTSEGRKKVDALPNINSGTSCKPLIYSLYCNINYNPIMEQSNHPVVKTTEANLAEASEAIKAIEAQLLEVKACIRSIEAVQQPSRSTEQLRALARKFFVMGAEAQRDNFECPNIEPYIELDGYSDGLRWDYSGRVYIEGDTYEDEVQFGDVVITDEAIDEVINTAPRGASTEAQ